MSGNITWEMILGLLTIGGAIGGIWLRISGAIGKANQALQEYKLHVAETYATKSSVNAQFDSVSKSIKDVGDRMEQRLDGMNERLDQVILAGKPTTRRTS